MVIPRRQRSPSPSQNDSQWLNQRHASRPWDSDLVRLKPVSPLVPFSVSDRKRLFEDIPPPSRESNPLNAFLRPSSPSQSPTLSSSPSSASTSSNSSASEPNQFPPPPPLISRLGNRDVQPPINLPHPLPLVGIPIPSSAELEQQLSLPSPRSPILSSTSPHNSTTTPALVHIPPPPSLPEMVNFENTQPLQDYPNAQSSRNSIRQSVRRSVRHSVRITSSTTEIFDKELSGHPSATPPGIHVPTLPNHDQLDLLPDSSSFLDFNDDRRLNPSESNHPEETSAPIQASFDDVDSFDTFSSQAIQGEDNIGFDAPTPPGTVERSPFLAPLSFPASLNKRNDVVSHGMTESIDDEDGGLDIPARISASPAAGRAMRELQRASITAANELADSIRLMSQQSPLSDENQPVRSASQRTQSSPSNGQPHDSPQKMQGQIFLRSRLFRRWNSRYASVVKQEYFGAVLLLFRPDSKPVFQSAMSLKSSKMIALAHSTVNVHEEPKKHNNGLIYTFSVTTSQRTYMFACSDPKTRSMWVSNLSSPNQA